MPTDHPLRAIRALADEALAALEEVKGAMYAQGGRPSVPPERLLKSSLLIALYSIRSERQLCEQLQYNLLFRWFLGLDMIEPAFDASTFSKNRERMMEHDVAAIFFATIRQQARDLMSRDHFSVDGTLLEAWASMKSFRPKDDDSGDNNGWADFRGKKRSNDTHESLAVPEARLFRKGRGQEAKLCFMAHALMENRHGLLMDLRVTEANGRAEREAARTMLREHVGSGTTVGADKGYDTRDFVAQSRAAGVTPHVAKNEHARRRSAIDGRTTRHPGYGISQTIRMTSSRIFGWAKSAAGFRRTRFRGKRRTQFAAYLTGAAYNLLRVSRLRASAC